MAGSFPIGKSIVRVQLNERAYPIWIGSGWLDQLGRYAVEAVPDTTRCVVIADQNTAATYGSTASDSLQAAGLTTSLETVPPGERSKSLEEVYRLYEVLCRVGADRRTLLLALGGGVVGDLAGFVAATFARGLPFIQVPTSLIAQVDSSIGGKVGVNFRDPRGFLVKNLIGAFYQPAAVFIDVALLQTLPQREFRSGLAEVIKYGAALDADLFARLEEQLPAILALEPAALQPTVARCCELKAQVVTSDEKDLTGQRAVLNFGHTFGHAIEGLTDAFTHGEAVAIGMVAAACTAELLALADETVRQRLCDLLHRTGLPTVFPDLPVDRVLDVMSRDKKALRGEMTLVLPVRIGEVRVVRGVSRTAVREAIERCQE